MQTRSWRLHDMRWELPFPFSRGGPCVAFRKDERRLNRNFRLGSSALTHLVTNTSAVLVATSGELNMFAKISKLSAPIAGAVFLASAGFVSGAAAGPLTVERGLETQTRAPVIQIDHRKGHGRGGGQHWDRGYGWGYYELKPRQIRRSLRHQGFYKVRIIDRRGPVYIVKARGWQGRPLRLVVDARTAQVIRIRPFHRRQHWRNFH